MKRETYPPLLIVFIREGELHVEYQNQCFNAQKGDVVLSSKSLIFLVFLKRQV